MLLLCAVVYAANYGRYEIAEMIARAGADMTATDHVSMGDGMDVLNGWARTDVCMY